VEDLTNSVDLFVVTVGGGFLLRGEMRNDMRKRDAALEERRQKDKAAMDKRMNLTFSVVLAGLFVPVLAAILPYLGPYLQAK